MIALENTTPLWLSTSPPLNAHISLAGRQWDADSADCLRPGTCQSGDVASVPFDPAAMHYLLASTLPARHHHNHSDRRLQMRSPLGCRTRVTESGGCADTYVYLHAAILSVFH